MGSNPINLALRFLLELCAIYSTGLWGWKSQESWIKYLLAFGIPLVAIILWGTFAVPNDPSRSEEAPVVTPGIVRLFLEFSIFGFAVWTLYDSEYTNIALLLGGTILIHYLISYNRVLWLISR